VRLVWHTAEADGAIVTALNAIAADTPYVGHSASLTRCRFSTTPVSATSPVRRRVYPGRLSELERRYHAGERPAQGEPVRAPVVQEQMPAGGIFARRWLVLEHVKGEMPDPRGWAIVAKALRDTIMSGYAQIGLGARVPASVSGHAADGGPLTAPHLAIAPLAYLDWPHADGRVLGLALIPPGTGELLDDPEFQHAIKAVSPWNANEARRELTLNGRDFVLVFSLSNESPRQSLDPAPYIAIARTWATCTPIVLDRHIKAKASADRDLEVRNLIARACHNAELPSPARVVIGSGEATREELAIAADKHSAIRGAASAYPSGRAPHWTGWRLPESLASRQLTHAVLQFENPVSGPVILGAGRFLGLGLCRALDPDGQ
jgi:CRISPR-associated protein Csb2